MSTPIKWSLSYDPWIDNGLELFGRLIESIHKQHPQVVQVCWQPEGLEITIHNEKRFLDLLDDAIQQQIRKAVFYTSERQGEKRLIMKPFVGFYNQPEKYHPPIYQQDQRKQFLRNVFSAPTPKRRGRSKGCPLCGEAIVGGGEKLTLSVYPFVTKIRSLSGIRTKWREEGEGLSGFTQYFPVCSRCYFLGSLVWADDALLYLCDIGGTNGNAVVLLPAPLASSLSRLREVKTIYSPKYGGRRTNVRFKPRPKGVQQEKEQEEREVQDGLYSLLLAFLESTMEEIAERDKKTDSSDEIAQKEVIDLFAEVQRRVSEGWLTLSIPQGGLKNITAHNLILDEPILRLLARLVEQNKLPYAHCISEIWVTDEKGRRLQDAVPALHEQMAKAILTDDFNLFALTFIPKPRRLLRFPFGIEDVIEKLVELWRWSDMDTQRRCSNMDTQTLEVVKKAGRALARIAASRKQPVLLYDLERVRSASDLLEVLEKGIHRLIGLEAEEMRYISLDALEQLTELIHQVTDARQFADLKNTLIIFAGIAYAKDTMAESRRALGGGEA